MRRNKHTIDLPACAGRVLIPSLLTDADGNRRLVTRHFLSMVRHAHPRYEFIFAGAHN